MFKILSIFQFSFFTIENFQTSKKPGYPPPPVQRPKTLCYTTALYHIDHVLSSLTKSWPIQNLGKWNGILLESLLVMYNQPSIQKNLFDSPRDYPKITSWIYMYEVKWNLILFWNLNKTKYKNPSQSCQIF